MPIINREISPYIYEIPIGERVFKTNLHYMGKLVREMTRGFSPIICICGRQRSGKSYIGMLITQTVLQIFSKSVELSRICFYEPYDVVKSLSPEANLDIRMIDESGVTVSKRQWYHKTHFALSTIINTQGLKAMCYIFISPFLDDIDKTFIKHFDFVIRVKRRGHYKVWQVKKHYDKMGNKAVSRLFLDDVFYDKHDLNQDIWQAYEAYSIKEKERIRLQHSKPEILKPTPSGEFDDIKERWGLA